MKLDIYTAKNGELHLYIKKSFRNKDGKEAKAFADDLKRQHAAKLYKDDNPETKSAQVFKRTEYITSPKTKMSVRKVRLNDSLLEELKEYVASLPNHEPTDRLFSIGKSKLQTLLNKGTKAAGLPRIAIHCFRHSHITKQNICILQQIHTVR